MSVQNVKIRVLVTGAAGCVGCQLIDELVNNGFHVVAVDRPGVPICDPVPDSLDVHVIDLTDAQEAERLARGVDIVVNLAAVVDIGMSFEELAPVNLNAVQSLYRGAAQGSCSLFIHFSTGSLYRCADHPICENHPLQAPNDYARTKLLSEDFLLSHAPREGPAVHIIRPALIFGPRGKVLISTVATLAPLLLRFTRRLVRLCYGPRTNLVHSIDVAHAVRFLIERPQAHGEVFNIANDDARPMTEQIGTMLETAGMRLTGWSLPLPTLLLRGLRPLIDHDFIFRMLNRKTAAMWDRIRRDEGLAPDGIIPHLNRESLDYAVGDFVFDNSKLKALGFEYRYPDLESGWRHTLQWYRDSAWIPSTPE